jgi:rhodanese-related sulfurtransferase
MPVTVKDLLAAANATVPRIDTAEARRLVQTSGALLVDVRDASEVQKSGKLKGAIHASRGLLEFKADAESPYHDKAFGKDRTVIVYCASGGRSALSGKTLNDMGYAKVYNLGGFADAAKAGFEIEPA